MGSYASATHGTVFLDLASLGEHGCGEGNGQVYTCKVGHVDVAHVRKTADWTAYLAEKTYEKIMDGKTKFTFKTVEPSKYHVHLKYPQSWENMPSYKQDEIARNVAIELGSYFSYTAATWHEILTWFGYKITGVWSEFPSAFGWEDQVSNAIGSRVAAATITGSSADFNRNFTYNLNQELIRLGIQQKEITRKASNKARGYWYSGGLYFFVNIGRRNLDIGQDGYITPFVIPVAECAGSDAIAYSVPTGDISIYDFSMNLKIEPREMERRKILSIAHPFGKEKFILPEKHFPIIMDYIREDALKRCSPRCCGFD